MSSEEQGSRTEYDLRVARELLRAAFTAKDFWRFCQGRPPLQPLMAQFAIKASLDDMIDETLEYCRTKLLFSELWTEVAEVNPKQFKQYQDRLYIIKESPEEGCESPSQPSQRSDEAVWPSDLSRVAYYEPEMILVHNGEFVMGSNPKPDHESYEDEQPEHKLWLPNYYISRTPVTNAQYATFVRETGADPPTYWPGQEPPPNKENHPVVCVTWYDAAEYCSWLSERTGRPYRLPSEAEWEKGARGFHGRVYPWGRHWLPHHCNTIEEEIFDTTPVGAYPKGESPFGLLDTVGNVKEWTLSLWGEDYQQPVFRYPYRPHDGREDRSAPKEVFRVLRGCRYTDLPELARCTLRFRLKPIHSDWAVGFRVVVSPA